MSKSRKCRVRELVEELISLGYQFYPSGHLLKPEEAEVEKRSGNSPELKFALDKKKRAELGVPHGRGLGWALYPTEKLQKILDKLEVKSPVPFLPGDLLLPLSKARVPKRWFVGRFSHCMTFSTRAGVRHWLDLVKSYLLEMNDPRVAGVDPR